MKIYAIKISGEMAPDLAIMPGINQWDALAKLVQQILAYPDRTEGIPDHIEPGEQIIIKVWLANEGQYTGPVTVSGKK